MPESTDRAVIFDMDGVLIDSYTPHYRSWVATCEPRGVSIDPERYRRLFGRSFGAFVAALCPHVTDPAAIDAWHAEKEECYRAIIEADFPAMPGAAELVTALDTAGFLLAIGSSGARGNVDCLCRKLSQGHRFRATVSSDDTSEPKPHPEVFLRCATALEVAPTRCAVIEDSIHGLRAARSAGMAAVGLTGTCPRATLETEADLVVDALDELGPEPLAGLIDAVTSGSRR
ncbi:MAG: HAD family hydrolase [Planctomycetota bacterium]